MNLGTKIVQASRKKAVIERGTTESKIRVTVEDSARREMKIKTGRYFLDHQIRQIAWRLCMNIDAKAECTQYFSVHTLAEDLGIVLGTAIAQMYEKRIKEGANGFGCGFGAIDESAARAMVSIEGRANSFIDVCENVDKMEQVEDMLTYDMRAFIEGFAQGLKGTVQIKIETGTDPHHAWEATFRALGEALKKCFEKNAWRAGAIAGVKGTLD